jgi:hypothetical protein
MKCYIILGHDRCSYIMLIQVTSGYVRLGHVRSDVSDYIVLGLFRAL